LQWELRQDGVEAALEKSRRGAHLWIFAEKTLLARDCRIYIYNLALRLKVPVKGGAGLAEGIEVFPRQDQLKPEEFGNAIRGPLGIHRATGKRYWFYGADYQVEAQLDYLERLRKITEAEMARFIAGLEMPEEFRPKPRIELPPYVPDVHVRGITGPSVPPARSKVAIAARIIWRFRLRTRASTSAGPDVRKK